MLAANEAVARFLLDVCDGGLFRIHAPPPSRGLDRFRIQAGALDCVFDRLDTAGGLTRALAAEREHPNSWLLNMLLLRSMARAEYSATAAPHMCCRS